MVRANISHCAYCFDTVTSKFQNGVRLVEPTPIDELSCPLFVTFNLARQGKWELRGCIGTFSPQPLLQGLKSYAATSAFRDRRFDPVTAAELPHLQVCVSLLTNFEPADHAHDWLVGKHGITIEFPHHGRDWNATYLPEIAAEQEWDQQRTIQQLVRKSGCQAQVTPALLESISVTRYQSSKCKLTYTDYLQMRKTVPPQG